MIIVIDDERTFAENVDHYARTSDGGLALIARLYAEWCKSSAVPRIKELWLDHDLGGSDDIRIVVDFLWAVGIGTGASTIPFKFFIEKIYIHSQNPTTDWIVDILAPYGAERAPLPELAKSESDQAWDDYYAAQNPETT